MKKQLLLLLIPFLSFSQSNYLALRVASSEDHGAIININNDIADYSYNFFDNGAPPTDRLVEINGSLYGITEYFGDNNRGTLCKYDLTNETFEVLMHFDGYGSYSKLTAGNDKLYIVKKDYFSGNYIIEIDPITLDITYTLNLNDNAISDLVDFIVVNNKLYGITRTGGVNNEGILFSYDLASDAYTVEYEFGSTMGVWPTHIMSHSNGKIYGVTRRGGANNYGIIYEFEPSNSAFTKLYDLTAINEAYTLIEGETNKLYGFIYPQSGGGGRIYQFDIATNTFTNLYYFSTTIGTSYSYRPLVYKNNSLYGINRDMVFSYNLSSSVFDSFDIFPVYDTPLLKTTDERIFFTTPEILENSYGSLNEINTITGSIDRVMNTKYGSVGAVPKKMILASNGMVYGITSSLLTMPQNYYNKLFSYNILTGEYHVLIDFLFEDYGTSPNSIIESSNGLIYITTRRSSGVRGEGKIIEYNPYNNTHSVVHNFSDEYDDGSFSIVKIFIHEHNNVIYGVKLRGGGATLHNGTIFSFNTLTHIYTNLYESADLEFTTATAFNVSRNTLYGITTSGGTNNNGYIFSLHIPTQQFTIIENINQIGEANFTETDNGDVYGILEYSPGTEGCIFKIDSNNDFSVYYEFDYASNPSFGYYPSYITSVNENLYVVSHVPPSPGTSMKYLLTEINTENYSFNTVAVLNTKIHSVSYLMNDKRLIGSSGYGLYSYTQGDSNIEYLNLSSDIFNIIDLEGVSSSVPEMHPKNNLVIYPNPAAKYINIRLENLSSIGKVMILNSVGKQVLRKTNTNKIDISNLKDGMYFVKVMDVDGNINVSKIIKKSP